VPDGKIRYDLGCGYCEPEKDQLPGSNKNFLIMEHWLDVSNEEYGVTLICADAPLFEVNEITMDEVVTGWADSIPPSQAVFSYLMNNYWETNYAASQEGEGRYSYVLRPHLKFDPVLAERDAISERQPLIGRMVGSWQQARTSLINMNNSSLIVNAIRPLKEKGEFLMSVYNAGESDGVFKPEDTGKDFFLSDPDGKMHGFVLSTSIIPSHGIKYFIIK
jgi:hypothetical protein